MLLGSSPPASTAVYITLTTTTTNAATDAETVNGYHHHRLAPNGVDDFGATAAEPLKGAAAFMHHRHTVNVSFSPTHSPPVIRRNACLRRAGSPNGGVNGLRHCTNQLNLNDLKCNLRMSGSIYADAAAAAAAKTSQSSPNLIGFQNLGGGNGGAVRKRHGKRVVFADDRGYQLVTIRIMTEPSDVPPSINYANLLGCHPVSFFDGPTATAASVASGTQTSSQQAPACKWSLAFKQPASDYLAFRQKVDRDNVALENVIVKNEQRRVTGTVKVKNLSFEKHVFVRISFDNWATYTDHPCKYKQHRPIHGSSNGASATTRAADLYDTFEFDVELEAESAATSSQRPEKAQFCICYAADHDVQHWDNNGGQNFIIFNDNYVAEAAKVDPPVAVVPSAAEVTDASPAAKTKANRSTPFGGKLFNNRPKTFPVFQSGLCGEPISDAFMMDMTNWTQFASWNHLSSDRPYW